jgi:hypothetical protein
VLNLLLARFAWSEFGCFGEIAVDGQRLYTVERPWLQNLPSVSCIPLGKYTCKPRRYNRGGYPAVEVCDVPGRTHILWHKGNTMHDLAGCIAVTSRLGTLKGIWAGLDSGTAFALFMEHYGRQEFELEIRQYQP